MQQQPHIMLALISKNKYGDKIVDTHKKASDVTLDLWTHNISIKHVKHIKNTVG